MLYTQNYLSSDVYTKFQNYLNSEVYTKFSLGSGWKQKESLFVNRSNPCIMDGCHSINGTYWYILMGCKSNEKLFHLSLSEDKSELIEITNIYKNATLESSPNVDKNNIIVYNDMFESRSPRMSTENISKDHFQQRSSLSKYTLFYERMYSHLISGVGGGKVTKEQSEVMHLEFGFLTVIGGSNAIVMFLCNNSVFPDGSNASVADSCCCINTTFVYVLMCYRYYELLLKNTTLESSPRIRGHNIDAYNRIFQSGLPLFCFERYYFPYTKCFLGITVGFPKFSLDRGGKRAENPTELINLNIEMFVFWNLPQSIHITTSKPLIESANSNNNGTSEGDPPLKSNNIFVDLMLTSYILVCCILRIMSWVRTAYITMY